MRLPVAYASRRWLEIALDYRCNLRCVGCHACHGTGESLAAGEALSLLREGRERGIERLWIGGGEPTLRDDLLRLVHAARQLGYTQVSLQTNAMRLAYAKYRGALLAAGVTEVRINVKSHRADVHDRLSDREGCHALLLQAIDGLAASPVRLVADVLLARSTVADLPEVVAFYAKRGVRTFVLWLLSAADAMGDAAVVAEVPRLVSDVSPALSTAAAEARRAGVALTSLHTPPCTLPADLRSVFTPASAYSLVVVGPDGKPFPLEGSSFEGGAYLDACARCAARTTCGGPRADYLEIHGAGEFVPIPPATAAASAR